MKALHKQLAVIQSHLDHFIEVPLWWCKEAELGKFSHFANNYGPDCMCSVVQKSETIMKIWDSFFFFI